MSEQLIYAMSTKGKMKIEDFNDLFRAVSFEGIFEEESVDVDARRQMIRILDSLGYCEFDFTSRKVHMCEPALVLLPVTGLPKAVYTGARIPQSIKKLKEAVKKETGKAIFLREQQKGYGIQVPSLICIEADSKETLHRIADECKLKSHLDRPAAWALASFSASTTEIKGSLHFIPRSPLSEKARTFNPERIVFTRGGHTAAKALTEYTNPQDRQFIHWYWDGDQAAEVHRDWGRYLVLSDEKKSVLIYDESQRFLGVPVTVPLPCLLARALTLCTGTAPAFGRTGDKPMAGIPAGHPVHVYTGIAPVIAKLIAEKLDQKLYTHEFEIDKRGVLHD